MTVGLGRTRNRHTCNRDMRPSSPSSFSVPLGYRAPQQAPTETRFRTCASADPSPGNEIAARPNGPTLPSRLKKSNIIACKFGQTRAEHSTRLSTHMRHPREPGPSELRPLGRGQANLPAIPFCSGRAIPTTAVHLRRVAGVQAHLFYKRSSPPVVRSARWRRTTSHRHPDGQIRSTPELPRVCARRRSRSPSRPCGGDTSRRPPFPRRKEKLSACRGYPPLAPPCGLSARLAGWRLPGSRSDSSAWSPPPSSPAAGRTRPALGRRRRPRSPTSHRRSATSSTRHRLATARSRCP